MEVKHREFIETNMHHFNTVEHGYIDNLDGGKMSMYEEIYHTYIDPGYVLTKWCGDCVFTMMKRLKVWWEANK